jgi:hypothetical protein
VPWGLFLSILAQMLISAFVIFVLAAIGKVIWDGWNK